MGTSYTHTFVCISIVPLLTGHRKADVMNKALPVSMWSGVLDLLCIKPVTAT